YTLKIVMSFSTSQKPRSKYELAKFILSASAFVMALCHMLALTRPFNSNITYTILWGMLTISVVVTLLKGKRNMATLIASVGIILFPLRQIYHQTERTNSKQLEAIKFIMDNTAPEDAVLDGWSGFGVFRPHAYYYHFLHAELRAMLGNHELADNLI